MQCPKLSPFFQLRPHQCRAERNNSFHTPLLHVTLQLTQQYLPSSQQHHAFGYGIHHLSQILFQQQCCQAQKPPRHVPMVLVVSCLHLLPLISLYLVNLVPFLQAIIPVSSLAPSFPPSSQAGDTCRFATSTFHFTFLVI